MDEFTKDKIDEIWAFFSSLPANIPDWSAEQKAKALKLMDNWKDGTPNAKECIKKFLS